MLAQQIEGSMFLGAAGFLDKHSELSIFRLDFEQRQERGASGQDGGLDDGVLGAVEAEEIAESAAMHNLRLEARPFAMDILRDDAKFIESAGIGKHPAADLFGRSQGR